MRATVLDPIRFARMAGSSVVGPSAAAWATDFLNAAYFARASAERRIEDLRLAFSVLTTRWAQAPERRLHAGDVLAFHRAFGLRRLRTRPRGTLNRDALLEGGAELLGDWFPAAAGDPERRAHGISFRTAEEATAFDPAMRTRHAVLGVLTPPRGDPADQRWHTYPPVLLPRPAAALEALRNPARWPDFGAAGGRFTALRRGGLLGQTFEIEVNARPAPRAPVFTRAYVSCTRIVDSAVELAHWTASVEEHAPGATSGEPVLAIELTTHDGHFLGRAVSRLHVFRDEAGTWVRDIGSWDPLPWHLATAYETAGRRAQESFWSPEPAEESMLAQLARAPAA